MTKNKRIFVSPNHTTISSTTSTPRKNSAPTTTLLASLTSTPRPPSHTPTEQNNFWSSIHTGTSTFSSSTTATPTQSTPNFSRTNRPWKSRQHGRHSTNTYNNIVQPPLYTSSTTSSPTPCRKPSASTTLTSNSFSCTSTVATPPNVRSALLKSYLRWTRLLRLQISLPRMVSYRSPSRHHSQHPLLFPHKSNHFRPRRHQQKL